MKRFLIFALCVAFTFATAGARADYLYTETKKEVVATGIRYEEKNILTKNDWIKAYVAYIDLESPNTSVRVLTSKNGSGYLENVKSMAKNENMAVAINADFFNMNSSQTNMIGMVYQGGELVSTPALDNQPSIVFTDSGDVLMDYFSFESTVYSPQGYSCPVYQINKVPASGGAITMITDKWGKKNWGNSLKELTVENGKVVHIKEAGSDGVPIPQNGYVLVTNPEVNGFLGKFQPGDEVVVKTTISPEIENIKEATGGNTLLVSEGKIAQFTGNISGNAQRSSAGVTKDGKTLILAATDGRTTNCKGLTQTGMANLMISLGAYNAINLDGGGSTTLVTKDSQGELKVRNSQNSLRNVSTAIGVAENGLRGDHAVSGTVKLSADAVLLGDSVKVSAEFYDEFGNVFKAPEDAVKFYDESGNSVANSFFTPLSPGLHTIYAALGDVICSANVSVSNKIKSISIEGSDSLNIKKGESVSLKAIVYDKDGRRIEASGDIPQWRSDNAGVKVENGVLTVTDESMATVSVSYDGKTDFVVVNPGNSGKRAPFATIEADEFNRVIDGGTKIAISGAAPKGATLLNRFLSIERLEKLSVYEKSFIISNFYQDFQNSKTSGTDSYSVFNKDDSTFITLSTSNGYVKNASEWAQFYVACTGSSKNLVITSLKSPDELPAEECRRIKSMLDIAVKNKRNVFFVYSGDKASVNIENNIRYISLGDVSQYNVQNMDENKKYCSYIVFYVKGSDIGYEFIS